MFATKEGMELTTVKVGILSGIFTIILQQKRGGIYNG
jgi:hypothetical protein